MRWIVLTTIIAFTILAVLGVYPREAAFFVLGLLVIAMLFLPFRDAVWIAVASIPLSPALPIVGFDTLAVWRPIVGILFLRWLWRETAYRPHAVLTMATALWQAWAGRLFLLFVGWSGLSLLWAEAPVFGLRQLLFLVNIALLFPVVRAVASNNRRTIFSASMTATALVVGVGYFQLIYTGVVRLSRFWYQWATSVIPYFYGEQLADLLLVSNTWFVYFPDDTASLRMFSLLPDSHSFALFVVIALGFIGIRTLAAQTHSKRFWWFSVVVGAVMAIVLSGTRGVWVALGGTLLLWFVGWLVSYRRLRTSFRRLCTTSLLLVIGLAVLLVALFPIGNALLNIPIQGEGEADTLRRARSSFDLNELSVHGRLEIWEAAWRSFKSNPLHGVGYGNFGIVLDRDASFARLGASAHNIYFNVVTETGLVGGVLFGGVLLVFLWRAIRQWLGGVGSVAAVIVMVWLYAYGLFDVVLLNDRVALLFVVLIGMLYAQHHGRLSPWRRHTTAQ